MSKKFLVVLLFLFSQSIYAKDAQFSKENKTFFDNIRKRSIPIQIYTPIVEDIHKFPLVIINHGYSVANSEYTFIAEPLAKQGYCIVSIQHDLPGDSELPRKGNLYMRRKPLWLRGVQNISFILAELEQTHQKIESQKIILIGHSNGGDISMLFTLTHPEVVKKVVSLDSLRMPFPIKDSIPILTLRANDTEADKGVLPNSGVTIINLKDTKHIDLCDWGPNLIKKEVFEKIEKFLNTL